MKKSVPARKPRPKARAEKSAVAKAEAAPFPAGAKPHIPGGHFILLGDCLDAMAELRDERGFREQVDLVYLDPPFNSKAEYSFIFGEENAAKSSVVAFDDMWRWTEATESAYDEYAAGGGRGARFLEAMRAALGTTGRGGAMLSYLAAMTPRLELTRDLLAPGGSIYLHCDNNAGHYLKSAMDFLFGMENFRNEIVWFYPDTPGRPKRDFPRKHDTIFRYAKGGGFTFNGGRVAVPIQADSAERYKYARKFASGRSYVGGAAEKVPEDVWRIAAVKKNSRQSMGYPTQKPISLLRRIILASSNPGDLVLDPYCGCGTTMAACVETGRLSVGIDLEPFAARTIKSRMAEHYQMEIQVGHVQPRTEDDFARLAKDKRYREFQYHAINLIGGAFPNPKHSGDEGVDGWVFVRRQGAAKSEAVVISVKAGGNLTPAMVRELRGVVEGRSPRPLAGILITMGRPSSGMLSEAEKAGMFSDGDIQIPRIQILPIRRLLEGRYRLPRVVGVKGLAGEFRGLYAGL